MESDDYSTKQDNNNIANTILRDNLDQLTSFASYLYAYGYFYSNSRDKVLFGYILVAVLCQSKPN